MITFIFGDSIGYGFHSLRNFGWADFVKHDASNGDAVYNLSIDGETTTGLIKRMEREIKSRLIDLECEKIRIIIAVGLNDSGKIDNKHTITSVKFIDNVKTLIHTSRKYAGNSGVYVVGLTRVDQSKTLPSVSWVKELSYSNVDIIKFDQIIKRTCATKKVKYIDVSAVVKRSCMPDGVHPNHSGHVEIYNKIDKELSK